MILAGKEYGTGSSRDWAAKGTMLLGVKAVIAESFERIHRSNLIGMGVLPLQFKRFAVRTLQSSRAERQGRPSRSSVLTHRGRGEDASRCIARSDDGTGNALTTEFEARLRIDTPKELDYYQHGGILQYVLRRLAAVHLVRAKAGQATLGFPGRQSGGPVAPRAAGS